jgi:hypothetical protein
MFTCLLETNKERKFKDRGERGGFIKAIRTLKGPQKKECKL